MGGADFVLDRPKPRRLRRSFVNTRRASASAESCVDERESIADWGLETEIVARFEDVAADCGRVFKAGTVKIYKTRNRIRYLETIKEDTYY